MKLELENNEYLDMALDSGFNAVVRYGKLEQNCNKVDKVYEGKIKMDYVKNREGEIMNDFSKGKVWKNIVAQAIPLTLAQSQLSSLLTTTSPHTSSKARSG